VRPVQAQKEARQGSKNTLIVPPFTRLAKLQYQIHAKLRFMALLTIILSMIDYWEWRFTRSPFSFELFLQIICGASQYFGEFSSLKVSFSRHAALGDGDFSEDGERITHLCVPRSLSLGPCRTFPYESIAQYCVSPMKIISRVVFLE
jgi:hypothetical protein